MSIPMQQPTNIADLSNKIALVTGASSGLGAAMAEAFVKAGAYVVNADMTPNPAKGSSPAATVVDLLNEQYPVTSGPPRALFIQTNVADSSSIEEAIKFTVENYGRLDIMVNNAGVGTSAGLTHEIPLENFDKAISVNVKGVWLGTRYATAQMLKQEPHISGDRGWIINTASIASVVALRNSALYCLTKGAVMQFTKASAFEYAPHKIHINCINPGFVETPFLNGTKARMGDDYNRYMDERHPWGRMASTDDIAKTCVFMAGDGVSGTTGQPFIVDGGYTLP